MAFRPLKDFGSGAFKELLLSEEDYLAYRAGVHLGKMQSGDLSALSTNTSAKLIGAYENTFYNNDEPVVTPEESIIRTYNVSHTSTSTQHVTQFSTPYSLLPPTIFVGDTIQITISGTLANDGSGYTEVEYQVGLSGSSSYTVTSSSSPTATHAGSPDYEVTWEDHEGSSLGGVRTATFVIQPTNSGLLNVVVNASAIDVNNAVSQISNDSISLGTVRVEPQQRPEDTTEIYELYQNDSSVASIITSSPLKKNPLYWNKFANPPGLKQMNDDELDSVAYRLLSKIFTNDYPGCFRLSSVSPSPESDWRVFIEDVFTDTRSDGSSQSYSIWIKTVDDNAPAKANPIAPYIFNDEFAGLRQLTNEEIEFTFGERIKRLIMLTGVGEYQLRSTEQGPPTDSGTWVQKGSAVNTVRSFQEDAVYLGLLGFEQNYTAEYVSTYTETYTGEYIPTYDKDYVAQYTSTYVGRDDVAFPAASLLHTLDNPNAYGTSVSDFFGRAVAISGNYAIVGALQEDDAGGTASGKAYIFDVTTGSLLHTLDNPNAYGTSASDQFGVSVAISGNYAIVGANREDDASGTDSGKAYIFDVTTGSLLHTLDNPNAYGTSASDSFGISVAISGNYAIVGALQEDDAGGTGSGKAYIFDVTTGSLLRTLDNPNAYGTSGGDNFGRAVAISGNYAIVGAYLEDDAGGTASGKAYIFDVTTGNLLRTLDNPNAYGTSASDFFGETVAISGNYAIVGAYGEDDASGASSGKAYIFDVTTGSLLHPLYNPNAYGTSTNDLFGISVAISGNYAIVGAYLEDDAGGLSSGKTYIFDVTTGALLHTLDNPNAYGTSASDQFGVSVAISGNYAIVGANGEDDAGGTGSGKAYIFELSTSSYGSGYIGDYTSQYEGGDNVINYVGQYEGATYQSESQQDYISESEVIYVGIGEFSSTYIGTYTAEYSVAYSKETITTYIGDYSNNAPNYIGDYIGSYLREVGFANYIGSYVGPQTFAGYIRSYAGDYAVDIYTGNFPVYDRAYGDIITYDNFYIGEEFADYQSESAINYSTYGINIYTAAYIAEPSSATYVGNYIDDFTADYQGPDAEYIGNYTKEFTATYTGDYTGSYEGVSYLGDFSATYTGDTSTPYTGDFLATYAAEYVKEFSATYTRIRSTDYIKEFSANYVGDYVKEFSANYTSESSATYTGDFSATYADEISTNYIKEFSATYEGNSSANYIGTSVGSWSSYNYTNAGNLLVIDAGDYFWSDATSPFPGTTIAWNGSNITGSKIDADTFIGNDGYEYERGTFQTSFSYTDGEGVFYNYNYYSVRRRTTAEVTYTGDFSADYTSESEAIYTGDVTINYSSESSANYIKEFSATYEGNSSATYLGDYTGDSEISYTGDFTGDYTSEGAITYVKAYTSESSIVYTGDVTANYVSESTIGYTGDYASESGIDYTSESSTTYLGNYIKESGAFYTSESSITYEGDYIGDDPGGTYIGDYFREGNSNYIRDFIESYTGFSATAYTAEYDVGIFYLKEYVAGDEVGYSGDWRPPYPTADYVIYQGPVSYEGNYGTLEVAYSGNYAGAGYIADYGGAYLGDYVQGDFSAYLGDYSAETFEDYISESSITYQGDYENVDNTISYDRNYNSGYIGLAFNSYYHPNYAYVLVNQWGSYWYLELGQPGTPSSGQTIFRTLPPSTTVWVENGVTFRIGSREAGSGQLGEYYAWAKYRIERGGEATYVASYAAEYEAEINPNYTAQYSSTYLGDFSANYTGTYLGDYSSEYTTTSEITYSGNYIPNYEGPVYEKSYIASYDGAPISESYSAVYDGETYTNTYNNPYTTYDITVGPYIDDGQRLPSYATLDIYTLYVRTTAAEKIFAPADFDELETADGLLLIVR